MEQTYIFIRGKYNTYTSIYLRILLHILTERGEARGYIYTHIYVYIGKRWACRLFSIRRVNNI